MKRFARHPWRRLPWLWVLPLLLLALPGRSSRADAPSTDCRRPVVRLETGLGTLELELDAATAPQAVTLVTRLLHEPIEASGEAAGTLRYYEGLGFDYTRPHVLIAVGERPALPALSTPTRIDAVALGLDHRRLADAAEAMEVLQRELLPAYIHRRNDATPRLAAWVERWRQDFEADFLVGVSRQAVNEALGHAYERGLPSLPPVRGAVALWPESPTVSTPRLAILLADLPERAGRWMVVGRVTRGFEVAEAISARPLVAEPANRSFRPVDPVRIDAAGVECRPEADVP